MLRSGLPFVKKALRSTSIDSSKLAIIGTTLAITVIIYLLNSSNSDKTQALATSLDSLRKSIDVPKPIGFRY